NNPQYSDLEIKCKDGTIVYGIHAILAARSEVFFRMLFTRVSKTPDTQISFPKIEASHMKIILEYLYTRVILDEDITADNASEVLYATDFFQLENLQNLVSKFYKRMCTTEGIENKSPELLSKVIQLMSPNADNETIRYLVDIVAKIPLDSIKLDRLSLQDLQYIFDSCKNLFQEAFSTLEERLPPWIQVKKAPETLHNDDSIDKEINISVADIIKPI
ncbi:9533_t:CDS:2, partial [Acaulospora colombiana]